jgi:hypothetical protein
MARRTSQSQNEKNKAGTFFLATLILWFVSVLFEIIFNKRSELLWIVAGAVFFQIANWVVRSFISRDPLFVNTSVSLLHSTIISVSGSQYFCHSALSLSLSLFIWVSDILLEAVSDNYGKNSLVSFPAVRLSV